MTPSLALPPIPLQRDEKDQLADSVRGDVVTSLLPVVDNFELARTQVKAETEAEQKINNSYQVGRGSGLSGVTAGLSVPHTLEARLPSPPGMGERQAT